MAASKSVLPRLFLLRHAHRSSPTAPLRHASSSSSSSGGAGKGKNAPAKPIVLEKPLRFNPPSHGKRLRKGPPMKHYSAPLTASETKVRDARHYPGLMAPRGSWDFWFWHSRAFHTILTMGTLFSIAIYTFFMNYTYNSPHKDLVPAWSDLWHRPRRFFASWRDVMIAHEMDKAARANENRIRGLDDVTKRKYYMKAHGIEPKNPVTMVFGPEKSHQSDEEIEALALGREPPPPPPPVSGEEGGEATTTQVKRKKWLGIF